MPALITMSVVAFLLFLSPALADNRRRPVAGRLSVVPKIGTDLTIGGKFLNAAIISEAFTVGSVSITASISGDSQDFDDVYHTPIAGGLNLNYGLADHTEVFLGINYLTAEARAFDAATINVTGTFAGTTVSVAAPISGKFDDYHEIGLNIGARHFFNRFGALSPYVSFEGGIKRTDKIELEWSIAGETISDISFYDESWTPNVGLGAGISYEVRDNISVGVETGLHYDFEMNDDDTDWRGGLDYEDVNNAGEKWSMPFVFTIKVKF